MATPSKISNGSTHKAFFILPSSYAFEDANTMVELFPQTWCHANKNTNKHCMIESTLGTLLFVKRIQSETISNEKIPHAILCLSQRQLQDLKEKMSTFKHCSHQSHVSNFSTSESVLLTLPGTSMILLVSSNSNSEISHHVLFYTSNQENDDSTIFFEEEKKEDDPINRITAHFPTLNVQSLYRNKFVVMKPNSVLGTDINTDLFVGKVMLILRNENDDYFHKRIFEGRKRRFEIQFQGRLKRLPEGILYCGGEITGQMKLGLMTKGLCSIILNLLHKMTRHMYYSFGNNDNTENARIVFPCWTFFDRIIVTPINETPPKLGEVLHESPQSVKLRKKATNSLGDWKLDHVYTMSFNSSNIDMPSWSLVNIPMLNDTDLHKFWGDSKLRIVLYDVPREYAQQKHLQTRLKYGFNLEISHMIDPPPQQDLHFQIDSDGDPDLSEDDPDLSEDDDDDTDSDSTFFFDVEMDSDVDDNRNESYSIPTRFISTPINNTAIDPSKLSSNQICPAWMELYRPKHRYETLFAFCMHSSIHFRSVSHFTNSFGSIRNDLKHPRLSSLERQRRLMGRTIHVRLLEQDSNIHTQITQFGQLSSYYDTYFLKHSTFPTLTDSSTCYGFVARALSEHHWREEWAAISSNNGSHLAIRFYHPDQKKPHFTLLVKDIINVCLYDTNTSIFKDHPMFQIETLGRTTYLMMHSREQVKRWVDELNNLRKQYVNNTSITLPNSADNGEKQFLHKSSMWECKQRRILNCRTFLFQNNSSATTTYDPCTLSQRILTKALSLSNHKHTTDTIHTDTLIDFLNLTSQLKAVDISTLSENQRIAFFLNLYHTVIAHALLVLSAPNNTFKFVKFFNKIAYQINNDIFSLVELEHNIIRAKMTHPSSILSKWILPQSSLYPELECESDYRINFAMNCGSVSIRHIGVQVYSPETLEEQLDYAVKLYLKKTVRAKYSPCTNMLLLELPKVCQWYGDDFRVVTGINNAKSWDLVVRTLRQYFSDEVIRVLDEHQGRSCQVKFASFEYTCELLSLAKT